jgi:probable F420-dependent oxidoreductase
VKFIANVPGTSLYPGEATHWWKDITTEQIVAIAQRMDELGLDAVRSGEHMVMQTELTKRMGTRFVDAVSAAGFVLGATRRITFVPLIILPLHNPIQLAKAIATVDFFSGGRLVPCLMVGYMPWEFEMLHAPPYEERGAVTDEFVDAMLELWHSDRPEYRGKYVEFEDVIFDPKPAQQPMPLWFGARTRPALRRIARVGDGWITQVGPRDELRANIEYLRSQPGFQQRTRPFDVCTDLFESRRNAVTHEVFEQPKIVLEKDAILEQVAQLAELGVTYVMPDDVIGTGRNQNDLPGGPPKTRSFEDYLERLAWFGEEILPEARKIEPAPLVEVPA